jgi:curli production assembly/transport component CsgG
MTRNEPVQLCVREAIEAAVVAMTVQGLKDRLWVLENDKDWESPVIQTYLKANAEYGLLPENGAAAQPETLKESVKDSASDKLTRPSA